MNIRWWLGVLGLAYWLYSRWGWLAVATLMMAVVCGNMMTSRSTQQGNGKDEKGTLASSQQDEEYTSKGYGRYKYCGLRDDPFASDVPPQYSLEPLNIMLPDLTPVEKQSLTSLTQKVADVKAAGYRTDSSILLRYLRARKGNVAAAEALFREAHAWSQQHDVYRALTHWNLEAYEQCLAPWWLSGGVIGRDRLDRPLCIERIGRCNFPNLATKIPWETMLNIDIVHCMRCIAVAEESALARGEPLSPMTLVCDLDGFGWDQVQYRAAFVMSKLVACRKLLMIEMLGQILVVNAPASAVRAWSMFKPLCDADTAAKMQMAGPEESLPLLRRYIDDSNIPAFLGGTKLVKGDPECRLIIAPGGPPPAAALSRLEDLVARGHDFRPDPNEKASVQSPISRKSQRHVDDEAFQPLKEPRCCCGF